MDQVAHREGKSLALLWCHPERSEVEGPL